MGASGMVCEDGMKDERTRDGGARDGGCRGEFEEGGRRKSRDEEGGGGGEGGRWLSLTSIIGLE